MRAQIIELASLGKTHSEIAKQLGQSQHTVRGVLRTPEARQHRERQAMADEVRRRMIAGAGRAVDSWVLTGQKVGYRVLDSPPSPPLI